jgi:hypothetical protein
MRLFETLSLILILFSLTNCNKVDDASNIVEVEQILDKPTAFINKNFIIQGVVNQVNSEKQLFSIISQREYKECGIGSCNVNEQLPVRYDGNIPEVGQQIEIVGAIKEVEKGFIYEAESIRITENL